MWVGVGLAWAVAGCGDASPPSGLGVGLAADAGVGGSGQGASDAGGQTPALAPLCEASSVPFIPVVVALSVYQPSGLARDGTPVHLRVVARGFGMPAELPSMAGAGNPDEVGWLRLAAPSADAGAHGGDAGAPALRDAGDAGESDESIGEPPTRVVVGPRALGELPVAIGEEVDLSVLYRMQTYMPGRYEVVLEQADRVLLFHQTDGTSSSAGFTLAVGDTLCGTRFNDCADIYRSDLHVTVPGGATATLMPGQSQTVGEYRVFHGTTNTVALLPTAGCADVYDGTVYSELTAVLLPSAR
jgi:hypothetical protein